MIAINVLHGFCYAFFFASVYIFVDEYFPRDSRASAQSLFNLLILGMGPFVGALLWGKLATPTRSRATSTSTSCSCSRPGSRLQPRCCSLVAFHPNEQGSAQPERSAA